MPNVQRRADKAYAALIKYYMTHRKKYMADLHATNGFDATETVCCRSHERSLAFRDMLATCMLARRKDRYWRDSRVIPCEVFNTCETYATIEAYKKEKNSSRIPTC